MKIVLTGGTGLIGSRIAHYLAAQENEIVALTRRASPKKPNGLNLRFVQWDACSLGAWAQEMNGADAIIHLAGEGIFDARWTEDVKRRIVESRTLSTRLLIDALKQAKHKSRTFVCASAVGYYGDRKDEPTEESAPAGTGFLADVCLRWEAEALFANQYGARVAIPRIGIVLDKDGGALSRMKPIFQAFLGMPLGNGRQWFPWIHIEDVARCIMYPLENIHLEGAYNAASPHPVRMSEFCTSLGQALHRPSWSWLNVPGFALRIALGEASESLVQGQKIVPRKLLDLGFSFQFPQLSPALQNIFS